MTHDRRAGISMVEVMVTVVIANIGIAALVSSFSHYHKEQIESRARTTGLLAAQTVIEGMKASDFHTLLTQYNDIPDDDPNGLEKGAFFSVAGLNAPRIGGVSQVHGEIIFVRTEKPDERVYGRDLGTNGLPYVDGVPDGDPDGLDLNANKSRSDTDAFGGLFDLNLDGDTDDSNLLGLVQTLLGVVKSVLGLPGLPPEEEVPPPSPAEALKSLRSTVRVTYEVLGQLRQIEIQTQLTRPVK